MSVLRQKLGQARNEAAPVPLTASRAMRLAMARAAQDAARLPLTVTSVGVEVGPLDQAIEGLSDELMIVTLTQDGALCGICAMDLSLTQAMGDAQTLGAVTAPAPEDRELTETDILLALPLVENLLSEIALSSPGTALDGWVAGVRIGERPASLRALGLDLPDGTYRTIRVACALPVEDRVAELVLTLPAPVAALPAVPAEKSQPDWAGRLEAAVMAAPASFGAVLHRMDVPLDTLQGLATGQVIPLAGCTVGKVRLETSEGRLFARGRLGQLAGRVAVRIEAEPMPELAEMPRPSQRQPLPVIEDPAF